MNEPRPGFTYPKVSFASTTEVGTEPEGWCVDLPYAVFAIGVNYSPLESPQLTGTRTFSQSLEA
jgi:hypothetical protein